MDGEAVRMTDTMQTKGKEKEEKNKKKKGETNRSNEACL
jgi:hypothetical protein